MAIFHLHIDSYRRSRGRTAVGGAAYRRGLKAACRVSGKRFNFRSKEEVAFSEFIPAQNDPTDYSQLANLLKLYEAVESREKHPRATLGREIEAALPLELTLPQQVELVRLFVAEVRHHFGAEKAFFDFSIHAKSNNTHAHICMSEREQVAPFVFDKTKRRDWDGDEFVRVCREAWQTQTNTALQQAGINQSVDCRSHTDRGLKVLPALHEGKAAYFNSEVKTMNDTIKKTNQDIKAKFIIPDDEVDINELRTKSTPSVCSNPDASDPAKIMSENFQYRLAQKQYENFAIYGLSFINIKHPNHVTLWFKDRSSLVDKGNSITASGGTEKDNAERMVELARLKNWKRIRFSGSNLFLREAFKQALANGLEIVTEGEEQEKLLSLIKTEVQNVAAASAITADIAREAVKAKAAAKARAEAKASEPYIPPVSKIPTLVGLGAKLKSPPPPTSKTGRGLGL